MIAHYIDSLLWRYSRHYRRHIMRRSAVWQTLLARADAADQPRVFARAHPNEPPDDSALERPAILSRRGSREVMSRYQREQLREKLTDELALQGYAMLPHQHMEYWCEHCPQYGECVVCGGKHER